MRHPIWVFIAIIFLVATVVMSFFYLQATQQYEDLMTKLTDGLGKSVFIIDDELVEKEVKIVSERVYLPLDIVTTYIDEEARLSNSGLRVFIKYKNVKAQTDSKFANDYIKQHVDEISLPLLYIDKKAYINEADVKRLYGVYTKHFPETDSYYLSTDGKYDYGYVSDSADVYFDFKGDKYEYPTKPDAKDGIVLRRIEGYVELLSKEGNLLYVKEKALINTEIVEHELSFMTLRREAFSGPVSLAFEGIYSLEENFAKTPSENNDGFNVLAPTWFDLNVQGIVINHADRHYVDQAHENGDKVWAVFTNDFNPDWTNELLTSREYRNKAIGQMLFYVAYYNLDGINLDFENMYLANKDGLTQFVRECYDVFNAYNVTMSIDVTRPGGSDMWSKVYDRQALQAYVDYVVLMAYDEHWGSSPIAGSVASMPWTEASITMSLEEIPNEKLILAMPLFMRAWVTNGDRALSSTAETMTSIDRYLENIDYTVVYDEASGQNYAEFSKNNQAIKVWFEDELSIDKRLTLYEKYDLPGVAVWRKGYEKDWVWQKIGDKLK